MRQPPDGEDRLWLRKKRSPGRTKPTWAPFLRADKKKDKCLPVTGRDVYGVRAGSICGTSGCVSL